MIILAAIYIIYESIHKWMTGLQLENLGSGTLLTAAAAAHQRRLGRLPGLAGTAQEVTHPRSQRQARADRLLDQRRGAGGPGACR